MRSPEEFFERVKKSFLTPSSKDERIKVVLICVLISTTFWFFNSLNQDDYVTQIQYPINIQFDDTEYMLVGELPSSIPLEVTGGGWDLMTRSFGLNMSPINIPLQDPDQINYILTSQYRSQLTPYLEPVLINFILQDSLQFDIQRKVSRSLDLVLDRTSIQLASDHLIASEIQLSNLKTILTGPEDLINSIQGPVELNLDLEQIDDNVDVTIDLPDFGDYIESNISEVNISFDVERLVPVDYDFSIEVRNAPDSLWVSVPNSISTNFKIQSSRFDATDSSKLVFYIDFNLMNMSDSMVPLQYDVMTEGISELQISADSVKLEKNE